LIPTENIGKIRYSSLLEIIMLKKVLILLALVIPTVFLCTILVMNQSNLGSKKHFEQKEYLVEGMTCKACEFKVKNALNGKYVSVESVDFETKRIVLHLDPHKKNLSLLNSDLVDQNYVLKKLPKQTLKVIDYNIKIN
tara:strand:+ start:8284 stop:8697 length:414 start_codon:yes stop_codon:yes gene_type:complete